MLYYFQKLATVFPEPVHLTTNLSVLEYLVTLVKIKVSQNFEKRGKCVFVPFLIENVFKKVIFRWEHYDFFHVYLLLM